MVLLGGTDPPLTIMPENILPVESTDMIEFALSTEETVALVLPNTANTAVCVSGILYP